MSRLPLQASSELQDALRKIAITQDFKSGTLIFSQGDRPKGIYLVESGSVALMLNDESRGKVVFERTLGKGSLLGLPATLSDCPYSLSARAISGVKLSFVFRNVLIAEMGRNMDLTAEVLKILSLEVHDMRDIIRNCSTSKQVDGKASVKRNVASRTAG